MLEIASFLQNYQQFGNGASFMLIKGRWAWKKHNMKFRHIGYNVNPYGQSFLSKCISAWNGLAQEIAEANTLDLFKSKLAH